MAAGAFHAWSAQPVTLHLRNGDRITGTISSEDTNRIVLSTPWLKELSVPTAQVLKREVLPATGPTQKPPPDKNGGPPPTPGTGSGGLPPANQAPKVGDAKAGDPTMVWTLMDPNDPNSGMYMKKQ